MVRPTRSLLKSLSNNPVIHATQNSPLVYSLGLSYAGKNSPPFISPDAEVPKYGFQGQTHKLGRWVDEMMMLRAGRGEINEQAVGGWDPSVVDRRIKYGAGEDFFSIVDGGGSTHLALSDGVGGWAPQYDPSLFSQGLMYHYSQSASSNPSAAPLKHLQAAYDKTMTDENVLAGSATAVGVSLSGTGDLKGINLGDSGLTILRRSQPIYSTSAQTHYFNCPRQLTKTPGDPQNDNLVMDKPSSGDQFRFPLEPNDLIILYTDGLSDNVPTEHLGVLYNSISQLLELPENSHLSPQDKDAERARIMADVLVAYGRMAMTRTGDEEGWKTPFQLEAKRNGFEFKGGKVDEWVLSLNMTSSKSTTLMFHSITVMTAMVSEVLAA